MCSIRWCKFLTRDLSLLYCNSAGRNCLLFVQEVPALYSCYWELGYSRIVITKHIANALGMTPSRTKLKAYQRLSHVTRVTHTTTTFPFIFLLFQHHLHIQFPSCPFLDQTSFDLTFLRSIILISTPFIMVVVSSSSSPSRGGGGGGPFRGSRGGFRGHYGHKVSTFDLTMFVLTLLR
jgi:hypothetical protein